MESAFRGYNAGTAYRRDSKPCLTNHEGFFKLALKPPIQNRHGLITAPALRHWASALNKPDRAQRNQPKGGNLVAGNRPEDWRCRPQEFMSEPEQAISDEVKVKMLARQNISAAQQQHRAEGKHIEDQFDLRRRPPRQAGGVVHGEPRSFARTAQAAAV